MFLSEREIDFENTVNFRDIGGIKTVNGKHTKWGMLFRSGELSELTDADLAYMESLNIKTILDLRTDEEIEDKPDMYPAGVKWKHLPIGDLGNKADMNKMMDTIRNADPETFDGGKLMEELSVKFINSKTNFKALFAELLSQDGDRTPLLFHCTAGKDRTGFSSAFILRALGVDKNTIIDEYTLSNYYRYEYNEETVEKAAKFYGLDQRILRPMMSVRPEWLKKGFDEIDKQYGSFDNYLLEIGVDSTAKANLRAKFLH
ncbi:tyrosine-protein phosphatase [Formosa algae]|uniref:tyrosine-protein phosphatase n=1 Tax=Formosa algae TaxID=225843 RepID=UPI000CCDCD33|nr:tyrosine-protein phosphatase [Formosa algae]PNW29091.1 hypothetical protein BKP44_05740 [Formosa algae]